MDNSFGGMPEEEFFLGYDAMIDEDDTDSINNEPRDSKRGHRGSQQSGSCCCIALLPVLLLVLFILILFF